MFGLSFLLLTVLVFALQNAPLLFGGWYLNKKKHELPLMQRIILKLLIFSLYVTNF